MKYLFTLLFCLFSVALLSSEEMSFEEKIHNAVTLEEKEEHYLEYVCHLSQLNTLKCDSIISRRSEYIEKLSPLGQIRLLANYFNNVRLGGSLAKLDISTFELSPLDQLLATGMLKCIRSEKISQEFFEKIDFNKLKDPTRKSIYFAISTCLQETNHDGRISSFHEAIAFAKKSPVKTMVSSIYDILSMYYLTLEDYKNAILYQEEGIKYSNKNQITGNTIVHLTNIGFIHYLMGNYAKSKQSFIQAKNTCNGLRLDYLTGKLYNYMGRLYNAENDFERSINLFQQALVRFYKVNHPKGLSNTHKNIGKAYFNNNDLNLAETNYELSYELIKNTDNLNTKGELHYLFAELFLKKGQIKKADYNVRKAISFWEKNQQFIRINQAHLLLGKIIDRKGNTKLANKYYKNYIAFSDSFHQLETEQEVAKISELYNSEQKERKITEQQKRLEQEHIERQFIQSELESSRSQNRLILIILFISVGLFTAIFFIIRIRNKQKELKKKQKEIELQQTLLRSQMNPHFIFNAMSVIQSYIYDEDMINSSKFLVYLSKLMRLILENNAKEFILLDKELEINERYLVIQKMRFENRFDYTINITNDELRHHVYVPPMLVQPFIENAVEHGDLDKVENGHIQIKYEIKEDLFIFTIEDNGIGRKAAQQKKKNMRSENHRSMAIQLTKDRIALLNEKHKKKGYLLIEDLDGENSTGTKIVIAAPFSKHQ